MRLCLYMVFLLLQSSTAHASAWMREQGAWFISSAMNIWSSMDTEEQRIFDPTFFAEYGLTSRVTIGVDYFSGALDTRHTAFVFSRFPLGDLDGPDRFSGGFGIGGETDLITPIAPLLRGTLSWGRGLSRGWAAVDTSATYNRETEIWRPKADFTWGYNLSDNWTVMSQVQTGRGDDQSRYTNFSPSLIYTFNDNLRITLGGTQSLSNEDESTVRLSLWQTF